MHFSLARFILLAVGLAGVASAQIDPGSLERTIPRVSVSPTDETSGIEAPPAPTAPATRMSGTFVLGAVQVDGASVFNSAELSRSYEAFLAGIVDQNSLNQIAAGITAQYRENGYFLSYAFIPEQPVQAGVVKVRVFEGYISEVDVVGGSASARKSVTSLTGKLASDRPLRISTLENVLGIVRDLPGVSITDTKLSRSEADPTRHKLTLTIASKNANFFTFADNRGTVPGARMRGYSTASFNGVVAAGDQLQVEAFLIPSDRFQFLYGKIRHSFPLSDDGLRLTASGAIGRHYQQLEAKQGGKLRQFAAGLSYPVAKSRSLAATGHFILEDWFGEETSAGVVTQRDRYRVVRLASEVVSGETTRTTIRLGLSQGLGGRTANDEGAPPLSRPNGEVRFTKVNVDATMVTPIAERVSLRVDLTAQYTGDSLVVPEEFALGGSRIGRAFDFNSAVGDSGVGGLVEISQRLTPPHDRLGSFELFAYLDAGAAARNHPTAELRKRDWLMSAGIGTRLTIAGVHLSGEVGHALASSADDSDVRAFFSIMKTY